MAGRPANEWTEERATVQVKLKKSVIFIIFDYKWESVLRPRGEGPIYLILALASLSSPHSPLYHFWHQPKAKCKIQLLVKQQSKSLLPIFKWLW